MEKTWTDYRYQELQEKAGVPEYKEDDFPEFDMDGCRFVPHFDLKEEWCMDDAYLFSPSRRLEDFVEKMFRNGKWTN